MSRQTFSLSLIFPCLLLFTAGCQITDKRPQPETPTRPGRNVQAPILNFVNFTDSAYVAEGKPLILTIKGKNPDGTVPSLSASDLPNNATFSDSGNGVGTMLFSPAFGQVGRFLVMFHARKDTLETARSFEIIVRKGNHPPRISGISDKTIGQGEDLNLTVAATDPDSDKIRLTCSNVQSVAHAIFKDEGNGTGDFKFSPDYTQEGVFRFKFVADDGKDTDTSILAVDVHKIRVVDSMPFFNRVTLVFERLRRGWAPASDIAQSGLTKVDDWKEVREALERFGPVSELSVGSDSCELVKDSLWGCRHNVQISWYPPHSLNELSRIHETLTELTKKGVKVQEIEGTAEVDYEGQAGTADVFTTVNIGVTHQTSLFVDLHESGRFDSVIVANQAWGYGFSGKVLLRRGQEWIYYYTKPLGTGNQAAYRYFRRSVFDPTTQEISGSEFESYRTAHQR